MEICVAGLGIIGGSLCLSLKRGGILCHGYNRSSGALEYALSNGIISAAAEDFSKYGVVFVAMPPEAALAFICSANFKKGAIVADICGVKRYMRAGITRGDIRYVGCHPMAGKEVSGISAASESLFDGADMIAAVDGDTDADALRQIKRLCKLMGFGRFVECSAETHDKKIAYTSQLAHVVSNAYVKDGNLKSCLGFTGGSFQDMTRIAGVDENVWASLYLKNADNLVSCIDSLTRSLSEVRAALQSGDSQGLINLLKQGREIFESGAFSLEDDKINITPLNN